MNVALSLPFELPRISSYLSFRVAMVSLPPEELREDVLELLYNSNHVIGIIPQSIMYGEYTSCNTFVLLFAYHARE